MSETTMPFDHFDRFFTFAATGFALLLAGGLNLALGRQGGRVWLRLLATVVVCSAVVGGLFTFARPEVVTRTAGVMFGVLAVAALVGSGWLSQQVAALVSFFRQPTPRWGLVTFGGLLALVGSGLAFDRADQASIDQQMHDLELTMGRPPSQSTDRGQATTDRGTLIVLSEPVSPRAEDELLGAEHKTLREGRFNEQIIRRAGPTDYSNCHGWVFTGGKFLLSPDAVEAIVKENGYRETHEPQAGDLVVYRQNGTVAHTAIVRYVTEGQPVLVEGKWGSMGVFLHPADKSPYGSEYTFYRSGRNSHLLVGLGGSPGPEITTTTE